MFPRKGSKAVRILRPQLHQQGSTETGPAVPETVQPAGDGPGSVARSWVSYRPVPVFNVCDLEGEALEGLIASRQEAEGQGPRGLRQGLSLGASPPQKPPWGPGPCR